VAVTEFIGEWIKLLVDETQVAKTKVYQTNTNIHFNFLLNRCILLYQNIL